MKIVQTQPINTAEIYKEGNLYAVRLYQYSQYQETFYSRLKRDIKPHLKKLGYILTYDFTKIDTTLGRD